MIPFSPPRIDEEIVQAVCDVLRSKWITTGPVTQQFENALATYGQSKSALCVSSATAGLELCLKWFGVGPGDEVIVPAYTYCATANVVVHCGARPVMVDIGDDFNIDPVAVANGITNKTKAIIPVDIAGLPCEYDALHRIIGERQALFNPSTEEQKQLGRILLLADAAHAVGAIYKGKPAGSLADLSVFSFHAVKNLCTAEGGAILFHLPEPFDNEAIYRRLRVSSLHGQSKDALAKTQKGGWEYDVVEAGYKCNMTDIQAAMGYTELKRYHDILARRKQIMEQYHNAFAEASWAQLPTLSDEQRTSAYHIYMLRIKGISIEERNQIIDHITSSGVSVNVHFKPLPLLSHYKNAGYDIQDYPRAMDQYSKEITLPVYYDLTDEQVKTVIEAVQTAVRECTQHADSVH